MSCLTLLALALGLTACGGSSSSSGGGSNAAGGGGSTLTIAVAGNPETLDPEMGQANRANELIKNLYAQWVRYATVDSGKGYAEADLSKPVEGEALQSLEQNDDGTVTMTVNPKAKFPDGSKITADDLVYKIRRSLGMNAASVFDFNILGLTKLSQVEKVSASEIRLDLPEASPILGPMLRDQDASLVDTKAVKKRSGGKDKWGTEWVSRHGAATGAYVIDSYTPGTSLNLKANPSYWGQKPFFDRVVLQVVPSADERVRLLQTGAVDIAADLSQDAIADLDGVDGVNTIKAPSVNQDMLGFVLDKKPFDDKRVRQAIAHAIPYDTLAKGVLNGQAQAPKGVWPQNSIWFDKAAPSPYSTDVDKAKELLRQAGYGPGKPLRFTAAIKDSDADAQSLAIAVQSALKDAGVEMKIDKASAAQFTEDIGERSMQAWIQTGLGSYVDDPYYHTYLWYAKDGALNWFKYQNDVVDGAVEQFATVLPEARKRALVGKVQRELNADLPMISLGEPNFLLPMRSDIKGFRYEPDGLITYAALSRG